MDTNTNNEAKTINGFTVGNDGKLRVGGKLVSGDIANAAREGKILAGFSMEDLKKKKARAGATGTADLVTALRTISPEIEQLKVGLTARIAMPKKGADGKDPKRSFTMAIVTKLNNLTQAGREWAGRRFEALGDPEGEFFYVTRIEDTETPHQRKPGGGRKKGDGSAAPISASDRLKNSLEASRAHLASVNGEEAPKVDGEELPEEIKNILGEGEQPVVIEDGKTETLEDAQVIKH